MSRRALRLLVHPLFWLAAQSAVLIWLLGRDGLLEPFRLVDTWSYEQALEARSWTEALSWGRTLGYPLLLGTVGRLGEGYALVPEAQALLHVAAALLFGYGVGVYTGSGWLGFAAATPVLWGDHVPLVHGLQTDLVAADLATAALAFLLLVVARRERALPWIGLTLTVLTAYHVRPVYVFLLGLVPLLGVVLSALSRSPSAARWRGLAAALLVVVLAPYLLYGALRWAVVGHFGLVSFGGVNSIGVTSGFLDQGLVTELPEEMRPLAAEILAGRVARGLAPLQTAPGGGWEARAAYNGTIFEVAYPAAKREIAEEVRRDERRELRRRRKEARKRQRGSGEAPGPEPVPGTATPEPGSAPEPESELAPYLEHAVEANRRLSRLSREIVQRRPRLFYRWIADNAGIAVAQLVHSRWIFWPGLALLLTLPLAVLRRRRAAGDGGEGSGPVLGLFFLTVGFIAASLLSVVAVSIPLDRFVVAIFFLLPSLLVVLLFELWRGILGRGVSGR